MAGACASPGDDATPAPGSSTTVAADDAVTPDGGGDRSAAPPDGDGGTGPPADPNGQQGGAPPDTTAGAAAPDPTTTTAEAPAPGAVGAYAPFYLRPAESSRIVLEIRSQSGAEPRDRTVTHLSEVLAANSGKEVTLAGGRIDGDGRQWTAADIRALADAGAAQSRDAAVMRILYLRGGFAESDTVLGIAVRSDVAAIFSDRVDDAAGVLGDPARIEDAVTVHEAGHLLGLVDLFLSTGRADPEHPGHSSNRASVMYWAVESTLVGDILQGGPPTDFDAQDRADLATIRTG